MPGSVGLSSSTYRLQLSARFGFDDASSIVPYLAELGVGALYLSPILESETGSNHGYDVARHDRVDRERGGEVAYARLAERCRAFGLPLVLDIVPNHVGVASASPGSAWWEVLQFGRNADRAHWFDIDWEAGSGRVLLPVLGDGFVAERDLAIVNDELRYESRRFPLSPESEVGKLDIGAVLPAQHYKLVDYRRADDEQNYRRFLAISDLAGLRVEESDVFDATHHAFERLARNGGACGVRVDHPDGLADPTAYLIRLRSTFPEARIWVEKILAFDEDVPTSWPIDGTTGYDALASVNAMMVPPSAEQPIDDLYRELTADDLDWAGHVEAGKRDVVSTILRAEASRIARLIPEVTHGSAAIREVAIAMPVYRTYLPAGRNNLDEALETAKFRRPELARAIESIAPRLATPSDEVCVRFQQFTAAVMAKGVEDTAFYRYSRFVALNEVGSDPSRFGLDLRSFHEAQRRRAEVLPATMTTLSTHDTKRGEDVRALLVVLAELPSEWSCIAVRLLELAPTPDRSLGYLLWQTLVSTGLIERERVHRYAEKSMREAARGTSWRDPDDTFEAAVHAAVDAAYDRLEVRSLIEAFHDRIEPFGFSNCLSQKVIQLTMPGVPDVYQGAERDEMSLVDPDNRRPVDFEGLSRALRDGADSCARIGEKPRLVQMCLRARLVRPDLFAGYEALHATGGGAEHLVAFDRGGAITLATRLPLTLARHGGWGASAVELPAGKYVDAFSGRIFEGNVRVAEVLETCPAALLLRE